MKKILFTMLVMLSLLILVGCTEDKYPPVESSEEESKVIFTLNIEDKEYEVRYELYRALFLNNKSAVDGGNEDVWSGPDAESYINKMDNIIMKEAAEIFSVLYLAEEVGYDPYSDKADYAVEEMLIVDIESCPGDTEEKKYENFLANLKKNNLNYATADLLYRYALAEKAIDEYYRTDYEYSQDDVKAYYYGNGCARILQAYFQTGIKSYSEMQLYRDQLAGITDEMALAAKIIGSTAANESDLIDNGKISGIILGKRSLSQLEYGDYINEIFSTPEGQLTSVITLKNTNADGYYVIYRLAKTDEHFECFYPAIANSYLDDIVGGILGGMENVLVEGCTPESGYDTIVHAEIAMR